MTIPFLQVSLKGVFECGQGYVAISRATSMKGLIIKSLDRKDLAFKVRTFVDSGVASASDHSKVSNASACFIPSSSSSLLGP